MVLPNPDNFPHDALSEILADKAVEQLGLAIELHEYDEQIRRAKGTISEALLATGDVQLHRLAEIAEFETESEENDLARAIGELHQILDHYRDELDPAEYRELTQQYNLLNNAWSVYSVVVDRLASHLAVGCMPNDKRDLQLEVMECESLRPDSKVAALAVIEKLLPGEGLDLKDPDMVFAELENRRQQEENEERSRLLKEYISDELDQQVAFLERYRIHPSDPAWQSLRSYLSRSLAIADPTIQGSFDAAMSSMLNEWLAQLHLNRQAYDDLVELVRPKTDSGSSE
jgi:hypothetical protein